MKQDHSEEARVLLRSKGFRATEGRVRLLAALDKLGKPLSISELVRRVPVDTATLYRALPELVDAGILSRTDLNDGVVRYEYAPHAPHHHHVVCSDCGKVEDLAFCPVDTLQEKLEKKTEKFATIYSHSLEFLGLCGACT